MASFAATRVISSATTAMPWYAPGPPPDYARPSMRWKPRLSLPANDAHISGKVNLFPGFSMTMTYTCRGCGELVRLSDGRDIDRIFGPEDS
jgi:hypothetical protein